MRRASCANSPSTCSSGCGYGCKNPSGSTSASRYPQRRNASKTRSRSAFEELLKSRTASAAVLVKVAIDSVTSIKDEAVCLLDSRRLLCRHLSLKQGGTLALASRHHV